MGSTRKAAIDKLFDEAIVIDALGGDVVPGSLSQLEAGITAFNATIAHPHTSFMEVLQDFYRYFTYIEAIPDLVLVRTAEDIRVAKREKRLGVLFGLQDAECVAMDLPLLTILYQLGLRVSTLTYNERNRLGSGCDEEADLGLTSFGRQVVTELDRLGILLDLSHVGEKTSMQAMEHTTKPPVFSHSNPKALTPSKRCITDQQIKAAAELGGVIGISVWSPMAYSKPGKQPELGDFVDRLDYVVNLVGIDHVGIGSDIFEGKNPILWRATTKRRYPQIVGEFDRHNIHVAGLETHMDLRNIAYEMDARGYSEEDIKRVLGGNLMRVLEATFRE